MKWEIAKFVLGISWKLLAAITVCLYVHEFSQQGKQINEVRRLVEERCR